jgi:hypothetical protein
VKARAWVGLLFVVACGPTVGDPCTTAKDCLGRLCLSAPGGYCSVSCTIGGPNGCPAGSLCIRDAVALGAHACLRSCVNERDCRTGYLCQKVSGSDVPVCVAP